MDTDKTLNEQKPKEETSQPKELADQPTPPTDDDTRALESIEPDYIMDEEEMMAHTIEVSKKLVEYEKALDMVLNFIIKRCYAGDFVSHDSIQKPLEERTANINNAAAERIARDLGIQEVDRSQLKKEIDKDGHYTYTCTGTFKFRGMKVTAMGQATTRNPFYSKDKGKPRPVNEIREDYIRTECIRDLTKQGVRKIFGLRKIPLSKLKELGYDLSKVRVVSFAAKDGSQAAKNPNATKPISSDTWLILVSFEDKTYGKTKYTTFTTDKGNQVSCWHTGETLTKLKDSVNTSQVRVRMHQKGKYWNIDEVLEVGAM